MRFIRFLFVFMMSSAMVHAEPAPIPGYYASGSILFAAINQRLSFMEDVALYKFNNGIEIEDVAREKIVLNKAVESAAKFGLDPDSTESFFRAQIEVAKSIQRRYFDEWQSAPTSRQPRDLVKEVRPSLVKLGNDINLYIALHIESELRNSREELFKEFEKNISVKHVSHEDKEVLFDTLMNIKVN